MPRHDSMRPHERIAEAFRLARVRHRSLKRGLSEDQIANECMSATTQVCEDPVCRRKRHCRNPKSANCILRLSVETRQRQADEFNELWKMMHQMTRRVAERMLEHVESHYREPSPPRLEPSEGDW